MSRVPQRAPGVILAERAEHLAFLATERTYDRQPELWEMGEHGRARTLEDFGHHFRALARGGTAFEAHVEYCYELFTNRSFPLRWLDDAWQTMREVCAHELDGEALETSLDTLAIIEDRE